MLKQAAALTTYKKKAHAKAQKQADELTKNIVNQTCYKLFWILHISTVMHWQIRSSALLRSAHT